MQYPFEEIYLMGEGLHANGKAKWGVAQKWARSVATGNIGDDCIEWPFRVMPNGYGTIRHSGKPTTAHRFVCEFSHGSAPDPKMQAAHSCGNRSCVNPRHLRWATRSENEQDKREHGTYHARKGGAKITARDVLEIRRIGRSKTLLEISEIYGLKQMQISRIIRGEQWSEMGD